jgi:hypothetical protein
VSLGSLEQIDLAITETLQAHGGENAMVRLLRRLREQTERRLAREAQALESRVFSGGSTGAEVRR